MTYLITIKAGSFLVATAFDNCSGITGKVCMYLSNIEVELIDILYYIAILVRLFLRSMKAVLKDIS